MSPVVQKLVWLVICGLHTLPIQAEVYKWIDKNGVVHYSDTKPEDESLEIKTFLGSPVRIDDRGLVVQAEEPSPQKPEPVKTEDKPDITLASLLSNAKEYVWGLLQPAHTAKVHKATSPPENTVVISNDHMAQMLEQTAQAKQVQQEKAEAMASHSVEILTTPRCGHCKKAIAYLQLHNISYQEYDVSRNASAALRQQMLGGSGGVPFAVVNGEKIRGWNQQAYARALGL